MKTLSIILGLGMLISVPRALGNWEREVIFKAWTPTMVYFLTEEDCATLDEVAICSKSLRNVLTEYGAELICKHFPSVNPGDTLAVRYTTGDTVLVPDFSRVFIVEFPEGSNTEDIATILDTTRGVTYACPNGVLEFHYLFPEEDDYLHWTYGETTPPGGSPDSGRILWPIYNDGPLCGFCLSGVDINAGDTLNEAAWDIYPGSVEEPFTQYAVGILDLGVWFEGDNAHTDLQGRIWEGSEEPYG